MRELGFVNVKHEKRDFYKDIQEQKVPMHHTLVTNPPYSDQHKELCLAFCLKQFQEKGRPFFLLMPNYVASRNYYRQILGDAVHDVAYLVPSICYEYDHPEGTGHEIPPFSSLWFCGVGRTHIEEFKETWENYEWKHHWERPRFAASLDELVAWRAIPTQKRPNPRQRKKRKEYKGAEQEALIASQQAGNRSPSTLSRLSNKETPVRKKRCKDSRYRDEAGNRTRKRF